MTVTIDATNLVLIDNADQDTGWVSSMGGLNDTSVSTREGGVALQDQGSQETFEVFHVITEEDYTARTIFGWQKSGNPSVEADPAGFAMYLGDDVTEVSSVALNAAGTGYSVSDFLTVALGSGVLMAGGTSALILLNTVGGSGEILTFTLTDNGQYITDPTPLTANVVAGGTGTGATFDLTMADQKNQVAYAVGGSDNFGFFFQGWSMFRLNTADLPTNSRDVNGLVADMHVAGITEVGYAGEFPTKAAGNSDNVGFDVLRYCDNANPALLIEGGTTGARGTWQEVATDDDNTNNAWGICRLLLDGSKAFELNFGVQIGSLDSNAWFEDSDFQLFINGSIPDAGAGISAGSMDVDVVGDSGSTNVCNFSDFLIQGLGTASNWTASADLDELQWQRGVITDLGTIAFPPQDVGSKFLDEMVFNNCGLVDPNTLDLDAITFNGSSDATGAMLLDENQDTTQNISIVDFVSDGTGHAIQLAPTGPGPFVYNFDNWTFTGYGSDDTADAAVDINPTTSTANITINILNGGDTPTTDQTGYSGTLTVNNTVTVKLAGVTEGAAVKVIANETAGTITTGDVIFELLADVNGEAQITTFNYEGAFGDGLDVIIRARQQGLANFAISEDNAVFVDETTESNSSATADMNLLVDTSPVAGQDWYYFGHAEKFGRLKLDITTAMAGGAALDFEYYDGASFVNLSGVVDATSAYTNTGENTISWTIPGDWATTSVDGNGPVFYIRIGYLSGTVSTAPRGRKCKLDVTRYIPFVQNNEITSSGLSTVASWAVDSIAIF